MERANLELISALILCVCSGLTVSCIGKSAGGGDECDDVDDCDPGYVCVSKRCYLVCNDVRTCAPVEDCIDGYCQAVDDPNPECTSHAVCSMPPSMCLQPQGMCLATRCRYDAKDDLTPCNMSNNPSGPSDGLCRAGVCRAAEGRPCTLNEDCASNRCGCLTAACVANTTGQRECVVPGIDCPCGTVQDAGCSTTVLDQHATSALCTGSYACDGGGGDASHCKLANDTVCTDNILCVSGHCDCADTGCSLLECGVGCGCFVVGSGNATCSTTPVAYGEAPPNDCALPNICGGNGHCGKPDGELCMNHDDCARRHCECGDDTCTTKRCAASDCNDSCEHAVAGTGVCTINSDKCLIGGSCYADNAVNPANLCQKCVATAPTVWSTVNCADDGNPCTVESCGITTGCVTTNASRATPCGPCTYCNGIGVCNNTASAYGEACTGGWYENFGEQYCDGAGGCGCMLVQTTCGSSRLVIATGDPWFGNNSDCARSCADVVEGVCRADSLHSSIPCDYCPNIVVPNPETHPNACEDAAGCYWSDSTYLCANDLCIVHANDVDCQSEWRASCQWNSYAGTCADVDRPCSSINGETLCFNAMCQWNTAWCAETGCSGYSTQYDCVEAHCAWYTAGYCDYPSCEHFWGDEMRCLVAGCAWDPSGTFSCDEQLVCTALTDRARCQNAKCHWNSSTSTCGPACYLIGEQNACQAVGCFWNNTYHCLPVDCSIYDATDCVAAGCFWTGSICRF